jgi:hypothetical protein
LRRIVVDREALARTSVSRHDQRASLLFQTAQLADQMAAEADKFAAFVEKRAVRGHAERRLAVAVTERQITSLERQRAPNLRRPGTKDEPDVRLPSSRPSRHTTG